MLHIYIKKLGTREKIRPEYNAALADLCPADTLTVTMLDRLGRNMIELITSAQDLAKRDHRLEILSGPLSGVYDPQGAGKVLFVVCAAMAEGEREFIHERTLIGLDTAAANGNHGGRPPATDGDMVAVALRRRDAKESVTAIAKHLGVGRSTLYRTLAAYDEAAATWRTRNGSRTIRSPPPRYEGSYQPYHQPEQNKVCQASALRARHAPDHRQSGRTTSWADQAMA
ncbi:recombinase family protein [Streptomyces sp. NPDC056400]|uniref:recombinase family protein n=1 Tax=Streptomyces sp. NPDC056400 TaxID=3345808 RepID=UPI0035D7961A